VDFQPLVLRSESEYPYFLFFFSFFFKFTDLGGSMEWQARPFSLPNESRQVRQRRPQQEQGTSALPQHPPLPSSVSSGTSSSNKNNEHHHSASSSHPVSEPKPRSPRFPTDSLKEGLGSPLPPLPPRQQPKNISTTTL